MVPRPGGELASRPLHFIWMLDCSNSMKGNKIEALNNAIRETIPAMQQAARTNPEAAVLVRAVTFNSSVEWHIAEPIPVERFRWQNVTASGETHLGDALHLVTEVLRVPPMEKRALPPVLALVTDGQPTDDWRSGLKGLLQEEWGRASTRLAVAIGRDANFQVLQEFTTKEKIFSVNNTTGLVECIEWVSRSVGKADPAVIAAPAKIANWKPNTEFMMRHEIVDVNGNTQRAVRAGLSGEKEPVWPSDKGQEIADGTVRWQNQGKVWW
jgi:uncharacterized protein YegL